jgi:hypothetical protein
MIVILSHVSSSDGARAQWFKRHGNATRLCHVSQVAVLCSFCAVWCGMHMLYLDIHKAPGR